jgi:rod shape-determining protein MreC
MRFKLPRIADAKDHILTAVILILSMIMIIGRNQDGINTLRKVSITAFSYLEEPLSNIRVYRQALKTNTYLRKQNVLLLDEVNRLRAAGQENERLRRLLDLSRESELTLQPVRIVGKELTQINNLLTIDAGSEDGIRQGMPMVGSDGLIGKVILVSKDYSQIMPFFNSLFRVSARLQESNAYGVISWNGESITELEMDYVPQTVDVDSGETVVTSGYSNQYPANIPIGRVLRTRDEPGKETQRIFLEPYVSLYEIAEGFVVKFTPDTTIQNLNDQYQGLFE